MSDEMKQIGKGLILFAILITLAAVIFDNPEPDLTSSPDTQTGGGFGHPIWRD